MTATVKAAALIVGTGFMGVTHARAIRVAGGRVVAAVGSNPDRAQQAADAVGADRGFAHIEEALADPEVQVVHVCTPNSSHHQLALAALQSGKHVVCEKPLATTLADARELTQAADRASLIATVPFVYRFHPLVREARARVQRGELGAVSSVAGVYLQDWLLNPEDNNWRVGPDGGPSRAFADIGSHLVDLLEFVTGERIVRLSARTRTVLKTRAGRTGITSEDLATVMIELEDGALGSLLVSQMSPGRKNGLTIEIAGANESVRFEQESPEQLWIGRRKGSGLLLRDPEECSPDAARFSLLPAGHPQGYQDAFAAFVSDTYAAIAGSAPEGLPTFADGVRAASITERVLESAASGRWIDVPSEQGVAP